MKKGRRDEAKYNSNLCLLINIKINSSSKTKTMRVIADFVCKRLCAQLKIISGNLGWINYSFKMKTAVSGNQTSSKESIPIIVLSALQNVWHDVNPFSAGNIVFGWRERSWLPSQMWTRRERRWRNTQVPHRGHNVLWTNKMEQANTVQELANT